MTTQLLEKVITESGNGDRYWLRPFNAQDSIQRIYLFESKKLEAKVKCGLELWRAQMNLSHGAWYPYLWKCGMTQPTASRRKQLAIDFLVWAGILQQGKGPTEPDAIAGLELVSHKPFILNDFRQSRVNWEELRNSLKGEASGVTEAEPSFNLRKILVDIHKISEQARYDTKARDALETIYQTTASFREELLNEESLMKASQEGKFEEIKL